MVSRWVGCVVLGLLVSGCGGTPGQVVAERAQARWDALIRGDLETAYGYLSPAYREVHSFERFQRGIFGVGKWQAANVDRVVCTQPDVCTVNVQVKIRLVVPRAGEPIESTSVVHERWVREGDWWYVPDR